MSQFDIRWFDAGKEPQCPPNPDYPDGKDIPNPLPFMKSCKADLPYPAKRIGYYLVRCLTCGYSVAVTTAGRPDDPRSIAMPCRPGGAPLRVM